MRTFYGLSKGTAFAFLTMSLGFTALDHPWAPTILLIAQVLSYLAVTITILRGLPVIIEGYSLFKNPPIAQ
jgi:hypothetical protein